MLLKKLPLWSFLLFVCTCSFNSCIVKGFPSQTSSFSSMPYSVSRFQEGIVVRMSNMAPRFVRGENRPYVHSHNLRLQGDRVVFIEDPESTTLLVASQMRQDEYFWSLFDRVNPMSCSNGVVYGIVHGFLPWEEYSPGKMSTYFGVTEAHIETWTLSGASLLEDPYIQLSEDVCLLDLFNETLGSEGASNVSGIIEIDEACVKESENALFTCPEVFS